jgi:RNA polymerase sigma-70 factor, ECF subfamily
VGEPSSLSLSFLARLDRRRAGQLGPSSEWLESTLRELDSAARIAWPRINLEESIFAAHLADRLGASPDLKDVLPGVHAADLFLACACSRGLPDALAEFDRVHLSLVPSAVRRFDPSPAFADDVTQSMRETFLVRRGEVAPRICDYSGRGALSNWVRVVAVRTAIRLRRDRRESASLPGQEVAPDISIPLDPELDYLKLRYRGTYEQALLAALAALSDRDALLLKLHYVDGLNIDRIGILYGVHRATVARWRSAARRQILASTREHLRRIFSLSDSEFDSLAALVRSQLTISIRTALSRAEGLE